MVYKFLNFRLNFFMVFPRFVHFIFEVLLIEKYRNVENSVATQITEKSI
jgi:hypothetical protein